jgi:hypothetical protein
MTQTIIVLWILCGLIAGLIYRSKRDPKVTAFLGTGPFAVVVVLGPIGLMLVWLQFLRRKR